MKKQKARILRTVTERPKCDSSIDTDAIFAELFDILESGRVDPGRLMDYLETEDDPGDAHGAPGTGQAPLDDHHGQGFEERDSTLLDGPQSRGGRPVPENGTSRPPSLVKVPQGGLVDFGQKS